MIATVKDGVVTVSKDGVRMTLTVDEVAELARAAVPASGWYADDEAFIGVDEASAMLGMSESAVRAWLREGRIPSVRMGRRWLLRPSDVVRFREASRR